MTGLVDNLPLGHLEAGGGSAPPLVLVHGWTGSKEDFADVLPALGEDRRAIAIDLPGHGDSAPGDGEDTYGLWALAGWVLRAADALGVGDFHLLGHSLGGLIVQRSAAAASHRLVSLVLMDTGLGALREEGVNHVATVVDTARTRGMEAAWIVNSRGPEPPPEHEQRAAFLRRRFVAMAPEVLAGSARGLVTAMPLGAFWRGIDIPVLVLHGEDDDVWTAAEQRLLARTVLGARHVVIPAAVHSPQVENPAAWLMTVRGFLADADATTRR